MDREIIRVEIRCGLRAKMTYRDITRGIARLVIEEVLSECNGNICKAAVRLKVHRNTLARYIHELGINILDFRVAA
jgi:DNA-binding NtrC family response regulator